MANTDLKLFLIAVLRDYGNTVGYRILDVDANNGRGETKDIPLAGVVNALRSNKVKINGIKYRKSDNQLVATNGAFTRYAEITDMGLKGDSPLVILEQLVNENETIGYKVSDYKGIILTLRIDDALAYSKINGIANGKIVNVDGTEYISSISGSYDKKQIKPKVKEEGRSEDKHGQQEQGETEFKKWLTISEFQKYMKENKFSYDLVGSLEGLKLSNIDERVEILRIPVGVTTIDRLGGYNRGHRLKELYVPNTVENYNDNSLSTFNELEKIEYQEGSTVIDITGAKNEVSNMNIPQSVRTIRGFQLTGDSVDLTDTNIEFIEDSFNKNDYTSINSIKLPKEVKIIRNSFNSLNVDDEIIFGGTVHLISSSFMHSEINRYNFNNAVSLIEIAYNAFSENDNIINLDISNTVLSKLNYGAFKSSLNLKSVKLPATIKDIQNNTLAGCKELEQINLENGIEVIGDRALNGAKINYIKIPNTVRELGGNVFNFDTTIEFEDGIEKINKLLVSRLVCKKLILPDSVKIISGYSFNESKINEIEFGTGLSHLGEKSFIESGNIDTVDLRNCLELQTIEDDTFRKSRVGKIVFPLNLKEIGASVLTECDTLHSVYIPKTVESFGRAALSNSGKEAGLGTTFYVHDGSPALAYCKRNRLRFILVNSIEEFDGYFTIEKRELDERKLDKFRMVLSLSEGDIANKLLEDKYINYADILIRLDGALKNEVGQYVNVKLDESKLISVPLSRIPGMEVTDEIVDSKGINEYNNNKSAFNNILNILTKFTAIEPKVMTTDALNYYNENDISHVVSVIYNDGTNKIYNLTLDGRDTNVINTNNRKYNIIVATSNGLIKYLTLNTIKLENNYVKSELLKLDKDIKNNNGLLTEPLADYIEANSIMDKNGVSTTINNAPVPLKLAKKLYEKALNQWAIANINVIKQNMYGQYEGAAEVTFICLITGKVIDAEVRYIWYQEPDSIASRDISIIQINNIRDSIKLIEASEINLIKHKLFDTTGAKDYVAKINGGDDYVKNLMTLPDAYDNHESYEFELANALKTLNIEKLEDMNEPAFTALVNTAYFTRTTKAYGTIAQSRDLKVIECDKGMYNLVIFDASRVRKNINIIGGEELNYCVALLDNRGYNEKEKIECYASREEIGRILNQFNRMTKTDRLKNINPTWHVNDEQIYKDNFMTLYEEDSIFVTERVYSSIGIDKVYGTISLVGYFYNYNNFALRLLNFKDIESALTYTRLIRENHEALVFHKEIIKRVPEVVYMNLGKEFTEPTSKEKMKIRECIMKGYPNNYHIGGSLQQIYDLCLKQKP